MPQYKRIQYGRKQYGTYISIDQPEGTSRWQFIRSRFGIRKDGNTYWIYQHSAVEVKGKVEKLRLSTNLKEQLYMKQINVNHPYTKIRMKTNQQNKWLVSERKTIGGNND